MILKGSFYVNCETQETTKSRSVAMRWYKSGLDVEVWHRGRRAFTMLAMGI